MKNCAIMLLCFAIYSFGVALSSHIYYLFFLPVLILFALNFDKFKEIFTRLFYLNFFIIILVLGVVFEGNFTLGILIFLRSNLIILFGILLFINSQTSDISQGFYNLKFGKKISALIYFCLNFINSLKLEFARQKKVLQVRGFVPQTTIFTYKIYANLIALLFLFALKKAEDLRKTMIVRGFDGIFYHTQKEKIAKAEVTFLAIVAFCVIFKFGVLI